jgi:hypothetical protein
MRTALPVVAAIVTGIGCPYVVLNPNVTGPHGEHYVEIACSGDPGECMSSARKMCGGDFDVIPSGNAKTMLVHCLNTCPYERCVELACAGDKDQCMTSARKMCGGDFDVLPSNGVGAILVHCQTTPLAATNPETNSPLDAGR